MLRNYRDLNVWQKSFRLCITLYRLTGAFPSDERFGLISQIRRAPVSIPSNIAEGYARETTKDYLRHLWIARGSLAEIETQLMLSQELGLTEAGEIESALENVAEVERMLSALIRSLKNRESGSRN